MIKNDRLRGAYSRKIVGQGLTDEIMFEQRPEGSEETSYMNILFKPLQWR